MKIQLEVERFISPRSEQCILDDIAACGMMSPVSSVAKAIYALLAHFCRENNLRTPSGKFLRVKFCQPESLDFLGL